MKPRPSAKIMRPLILRPETPLSRRYLKVIEQWIPIGRQYFAAWPVRPDCGHFLGGCHWYGIETLAGALAFAAAASSPDYDPTIGGCSRQELRTMARQAIRYLCFTHDSGPEDCVRPAKGLGRPENFGTKWGERGLGFFRESQCGTTVAGIAVVARLLGKAVDAETWALIETVHADYAARFGTMDPKNGVYLDTQMEENGWTSCGLASVVCLLKSSPEIATWTETAQRWMFSTAAAPQDAKNQQPFADGKTVADLTGKTFTALPDYMAENHGMVHPNYTAASVHFTGVLGVIYGAFGESLPPHALFNRDQIYAQLKLTTDRTGSLHPVQGMDWPYHFTDPGTTTHAAAAVLGNDPDAARMERWALATLEMRQASHGGRMIDPTVAEVCHDVQDPMAIRECLITGPAYTYLLHRLHGDGPRPTTDRELERRLRGVKVFPHSGFIFQRHPRGQTSLSWRNCQMALPLTCDGIQMVAPASHSWLGQVKVEARPDSQVEISVHTELTPESFATAMVLDRAQGAVRQQVLYAGLPDGTSLSFERWVARETVLVRDSNLGFLRIVNERFSAMQGNCRGHRIITTPAGKIKFAGYVSADLASDLIETYAHPGWINVDGRLGIVYQGTGETVYHNRHHFPVWWATADDLTLSRQAKHAKYRTGQIIAQLSALITPDQSAAQTAATSFTMLSAGPDGIALLGAHHLAAVNFGPKELRAKFQEKRLPQQPVPIFAGRTEIHDDRVTRHLKISPGHAILRRALATLDLKGSVEIHPADSAIFVRNVGPKTATLGRAGKTASIRPGQLLELKNG